MDQRERYLDQPETIRVALEALQTTLWTALPCVVTAFPAASGLGKMMLDAQPSIAARVLNAKKGTFDTIQYPLLVDVPILWQGGGGCTMTFPIKPGDECLVIFASRCIDFWWQQGPGTAEATGNIVPPPNQRMHSLSDGFALVGVRSLPREFDVDAKLAQLRSDDNAATVSIDPDAHHISVLTTDGDVDVISDSGKINVTANQGDVTITTSQGKVSANGVKIDKDGNMTVPGNITCSKTITGNTDVVTGTISLKNHKTTLVQPGTGLGGPPQ